MPEAFSGQSCLVFQQCNHTLLIVTNDVGSVTGERLDDRAAQITGSFRINDRSESSFCTADHLVVPEQGP